MSSTSLRGTDLKSVPLFANIPDAYLDRLLGAFDSVSLARGDTLFGEGSIADRFLLLVEGEIDVRAGSDRITVLPFAPVGELGALAGLTRNTTAVATRPSRLLAIAGAQLFAFFKANGDIGFRFHDNLMRILADKIERDHRREEEMRANLVETQKAMKRMRDALLDADDTPLHRTMFEELDAHIEHNRRGRYLVVVPRALPIRLRIDGEREVLRVSNERLFTRIGPGAPLVSGALFTGVLTALEAEIPVSGTVGAQSPESVELVLDVLIDESAQQLERLLARVQLLDIVL